MYGGIEDADQGMKIQASSDIYSMKIFKSKCGPNLNFKALEKNLN